MFFCGIVLSQDYKPVNILTPPETTSPLYDVKKTEQLTIIKNNERKFSAPFENVIPEFLYGHNKQPVKNEPLASGIVSSFRSNIRFGGFWDKYTVINLTPQMSIKPYDFISFYAFRSMSYFIPMSGIKQNFKSMAIKGISVMAVDYAIKFIISSGKVIGPLTSFIAKNILITVLNRVQQKDDAKNNLLNYDYQYYSVSIRF